MANGHTHVHRRRHTSHHRQQQILAVMFFIAGVAIILGLLYLINQPGSFEPAAP
jgi:hypothetical protein